jgi:hypothetical protein
MNDMQDEVRQLLQDKATEMPPHLDVPPSLRKRVRPRIARNALLVAASAAVITVGAVAGFRSLNGPPEEQSLGSGTPTQSVDGSDSCGFDQLLATTRIEGAMGSREGTIDLRNVSADTCTLHGTPGVTVTDSDLHAIDGVTVVGGPPGWKVEDTPEPDGWPVVTLAPGGAASVRIRWANWCDTDTSPLLQLADPAGNEVAMVNPDAGSVPPCNGDTMPSTIEIGPFEPSS